MFDSKEELSVCLNMIEVLDVAQHTCNLSAVSLLGSRG